MAHIGPDPIPDLPPVDPDASAEIARRRVLDCGWMPDRRDRPVSAILEPLSLSYQSMTWHLDSDLDQGSEGACVGFGCTHEAAADPAPHPELLSNGYASGWYNRAKEIDEWSGVAYDGTSVRAGMSVGVERGLYGQYRWCQSIDDARLVIGNLGPIVIGVNWYYGMDTPDGWGWIHPTGGIRGGHCVCLKGVNEEGDYFRGQNSWSRRWGKGGEFLLSFDDAHFLFSGRTDWAVPVVRN